MQDSLCFQNYNRNNFNYTFQALLKWKTEAAWSCKYIQRWPDWKLLPTQACPGFIPISLSFLFLPLHPPPPFPLLTCPTQISVHNCAEKQGGFWLIQERGWGVCCCVLRACFCGDYFIFDRAFFIAVQESVVLWLWLSIQTLVCMLKRDLTGCSDALEFFLRTS